ncbi:MAG: TolC family protein [Deltaproteobacteria bacterium]|nr:TolC family protein [Deltaproteobacteria bacterium]
MKKIFLTLVAVLAATPVHAVTLDQVIEAVRASHPSIRRAKWDAREAGARRMVEGWLPDPSVGIEFEQIPKSRASLKNSEMINYSVSQEIPFPGTLVSRSQAAGAEYKARKSLVTSAEREEIFKAKETWFKLVATISMIKEKKTVLSHLNDISSSLQTSFAAGKEAFGGVGMFQMKKGEIEAELLDLNHLKSASESELNLLMGRPAHEPLVVESVPPIKKLKVPAEELETRLFAQNSELAAYGWMSKKAKKEASATTLGLVPTLEPEFMFNQRENMEDAYTLKLSMNVPLWLNRNMAEIRGARAAYRRSRAEYDQASLTARTELHNLIHHATEHYKILGKYKSDILPAARQAMKSGMTLFSSGRMPVGEIWLAATGYQEAVQMYWEAWEDYQMEYALLEQMIGEDL